MAADAKSSSGRGPARRKKKKSGRAPKKKKAAVPSGAAAESPPKPAKAPAAPPVKTAPQAASQEEAVARFDAVQQTPPYTPPPPPPPDLERDRTRPALATFLGVLILGLLAFLSSCEERSILARGSALAELAADGNTNTLARPEEPATTAAIKNDDERVKENKRRRAAIREYKAEVFKRRLVAEANRQDIDKLRAELDVARAGRGSASGYAFLPKALGFILLLYGLTALYRDGAPRDRAVILAVLVLLIFFFLRQDSRSQEQNRRLQDAPAHTVELV